MNYTKNDFTLFTDDAICERTTENGLTNFSEDLALQLIEEPLNLNFGQLDDSINMYQPTSNVNIDVAHDKGLYTPEKGLYTPVKPQLASASSQSSHVPSCCGILQSQELSMFWQSQVCKPQGQQLDVMQDFQPKVSGDQEIRYQAETQQQLFPQIQQQQQLQQQFGVLEQQQQQQQQQMQQHHQQQFMQFGIGIPAGVELQNLLAWQQQNNMVAPKKERLRWIPALHQLFVEVVYKLGGPWQATPKSIVNMMKESGVQAQLDINHIKSHLQKYRQSLKSSENFKSSSKRKSPERDMEDEEVGIVTKRTNLGDSFTSYREGEEGGLHSFSQTSKFSEESQKVPVFWEKLVLATKQQHEQEGLLWKVRQNGFVNKSEYDRFVQAGTYHRNMMEQLIGSYRIWNEKYKETLRMIDVSKLSNTVLPKQKSSCGTSGVCTSSHICIKRVLDKDNPEINLDV